LGTSDNTQSNSICAHPMFLHRETCRQLMHGLLQGHYHPFLTLNGMPLCLL
jgi:hypothetical protein